MSVRPDLDTLEQRLAEWRSAEDALDPAAWSKGAMLDAENALDSLKSDAVHALPALLAEARKVEALTRENARLWILADALSDDERHGNLTGRAEYAWEQFCNE